MLKISRTNADGKTLELIAYADDWDEVGTIVYDDRGNIDWEASYIIEPEETVESKT